MGRIVEHVVTQTIRRLELTREDVEKRKGREAANSRMKVHPAITRHEQYFAERLAKYLGEGNIEFSIITGADHEDDLFYTAENLDAIFVWLDSFMK